MDRNASSEIGQRREADRRSRVLQLARKTGLNALLIVCLLPFFITSAYAEKVAGFRLGVGAGLFYMRAKTQNNPNTYKALIPGYTARLGYAFSPSWEVGAMLSGGGKRSDTQGATTVNLKMPVFPQAYILGRYYSSQTYGVYGLFSLGALKQEVLNTTGQVINTQRSVALGVGAGLFWDVSDHYTIDVGGFMPGIRLSNSNSALKTYMPGLLVTLSYAFGDDDNERTPIAMERDDEPVEMIEVTPQLKQIEAIKPEPVIEKDINSVAAVQSERVIERPALVAEAVPSGSADADQPPKVSTNQKQQTDSLVSDTIEDWRKAWSAQDLDAYFAAYSNDFNGGRRFKTRADWASYKRRVILKRSFIRVTLNDVKIVHKDNQVVKVTFKQYFQSNSYHSDDHKTLWLKNIRGTWKIFRETASLINKVKKR
ncbi:MAG: porin family protein [Mariprofundus sp.]|nr:porin family protein [Mariprofundus sp.]